MVSSYPSVFWLVGIPLSGIVASHSFHCCITVSWGCQLSSIGCLPRWWIGEHTLDIESTGEIKYPGRTWKLTYNGLPRGNQDLGQSGNCKWEAALAKLTVGGDECNQYSYRSKTDRWRWEPSRQPSHCDMEGKEKPPHYDLKAATKVLWWIHLVLNCPE
jgi:hypothetical protein